MHEYVICILNNMFHKKRIGGKHTEEKNLFRSLKFCKKQEQRQIMTDWAGCVQQGLVIRQKKTNQLHVSLNPRKIKEIRTLIGEDKK